MRGYLLTYSTEGTLLSMSVVTQAGASVSRPACDVLTGL